MSYCRFSDADIYVFAHVGGGFECCACNLSEPIKSIFTVGCQGNPIWKDLKPCEECGGEGCEACMMNDNTRVETRSELIVHIQEHIDAGDDVPDDVIPRLQREIEEEGEYNEPIFDDGYDGPAAIDFKTGEIQKLTELVEELEEN